MREEIDTNLNEEEEIIMDGINNEHLRDVYEEGEYKKDIHSLSWEVYVK